MKDGAGDVPALVHELHSWNSASDGLVSELQKGLTDDAA